MKIILASSITPLLHSVLQFLVAVLVGVLAFWGVGQFIADARVKNILGAIIAVILLIFAITLFLPNL